MASFKSVLPLWRQIGFRRSHRAEREVRLRPMARGDLNGTTLELILDQVIDIAAVSRLPLPAACRGGC